MIAAGLLGVFVAVFAFDVLFPSLDGLGIRGVPQSITLNLLLGMPYGTLAIVLGIVFLGISALADRFDPARAFDEKPPEDEPLWTRLIRREWHWLPAGVVAGLLIIAATAQGEYLGISGGFAALTAHIGQLFGHPLQSTGPLNEHTLWRAAMVVGLFPGAFVSSFLSRSLQPQRVTPLWQEALGPSLKKRLALVFVGGFLIQLGALIGGGCTTGALMAGWPTLSVGSFVMGMVFFGSAMGVAHLLYWGRWRTVSEVKARGLSLATD